MRHLFAALLLAGCSSVPYAEGETVGQQHAPESGVSPDVQADHEAAAAEAREDEALVHDAPIEVAPDEPFEASVPVPCPCTNEASCVCTLLGNHGSETYCVVNWPVQEGCDVADCIAPCHPFGGYAAVQGWCEATGDGCDPEVTDQDFVPDGYRCEAKTACQATLKAFASCVACSAWSCE